MQNIAYPLIAALTVAYFFLFLMCLVCYVFYSLSIYTLAKRKGVPHAWMAWLPVVNGIIMGKVSATPDKKRRTHIALPVLEGLLYVMLIGVIVLLVGSVAFAGRGQAFFSRGPAWGMRSAMHSFAPVVSLLGTYFVMLGVSIAYMVVFYMALYRIYKQFAPEYATFFTVMSIVFNTLYPFFLFAVRNKPYRYDDGDGCACGCQCAAPAIEAPPSDAPQLPSADPGSES